MTVCLGKPDAVPYFDMAIYSSTFQMADHPGHVPQDHMGRYPPEVWRLVQSLASRIGGGITFPSWERYRPRSKSKRGGGERIMLPGETSTFPKVGGERIMLPGETSTFPKVGGEHIMLPGETSTFPKVGGEHIMLPGETSMFPKVGGSASCSPGKPPRFPR